MEKKENKERERMKISQLIEKLKYIEEHFGDIEVDLAQNYKII